MSRSIRAVLIGRIFDALASGLDVLSNTLGGVARGQDQQHYR